MASAFEVAWIRARGRCGAHRYRLAGLKIEARVAGCKLSDRILCPLRHLEARNAIPGHAHLAIDLWDGEATGVPCPLRNLRDVFYRTRPFGRHVLGSSRDGRWFGYQTHQALTVLDRGAGRLIGHIASPDRLSLYELGKPLQPLLFAWLSNLDIVPVHAALVSRAGEGILLGGAGGAGKTTTALLCAHRGFDYLGDDYIAVPPPLDGTYAAHSLYSSTWLDPGHLSRFPWLEDHAVEVTETEDKRLVLLSDVEGIGLAGSARVRALALPQVTGALDSAWRRASGAEAVLRLAPSSILQLPFIAPPGALERMTGLAETVPCFWLDLGTDLDQIPEQVAEILEDALMR